MLNEGQVATRPVSMLFLQFVLLFPMVTTGQIVTATSNIQPHE